MEREVNRREFVTTGAAAGTVLAATTAFTAAQAQPPAATPAGQRPVRLDLLTSREVGDWFKTSDVIFVPHGPISGHGPWTSLGIHPHGAEAVATLMARKCNGLVYPTVYTCFAGATRLYPGTVPFSYEFHVQVLKQICRSLAAQGFGRIFLVNYTNPEDLAGNIAARDMFDIEGEAPVAALDCKKARANDPIFKKLAADYKAAKGNPGEAIVDYAAMRVLNHPREIVEPELAKGNWEDGQDQNPAIRAAINILRRSGTRGFRYDAEREHSAHGTVGLQVEGKPDIELGLKMLEAQAEWLLPAVEALKQHREYIKARPPKRLEKQVPFGP